MVLAEVSSKNYLVAAVNALVFSVIYMKSIWNELYLKVGLETPNKEQKLGEKSSWKKLHFKLGTDL